MKQNMVHHMQFYIKKYGKRQLDWPADFNRMEKNKKEGEGGVERVTRALICCAEMLGPKVFLVLI